jgi:two-component system, chemotaxis family, chemotaxis protein CheY
MTTPVKRRILVVEDHDRLRDVIVASLQERGHDVRAAGDGKKALELQAASPADVLITDLFMPEKEGLETIGEFRRRYPTVAIIAISGGSPVLRQEAPDYLEIAKGLGARATLQKPFSGETLAAAVDSLGAPVASAGGDGAAPGKPSSPPAVPR